jgi:hypothetical protein
VVLNIRMEGGNRGLSEIMVLFGICLQNVGKSTKDFELQITWPKLELSNDRAVSEYRCRANNVALRGL